MIVRNYLKSINWTNNSFARGLIARTLSAILPGIVLINIYLVLKKASFWPSVCSVRQMTPLFVIIPFALLIMPFTESLNIITTTSEYSQLVSYVTEQTKQFLRLVQNILDDMLGRVVTSLA